MIGIYCFTNKINNKKYIGQSINIEERYKAHKYNYSKNNTCFYKAINEYGWDNFSFKVLEQCLIKELNDKEKYWIQYFDSFNNGYNSTSGTQGEHYEVKEESRLKHSGENHPFSVLTEDDVFNIREYRLQGLKRLEVYNKYKDKISIKGFQHIWQGDRWTFIHMDIYEKIPKSNKQNPLYSNDTIYNLRLDFMNGLSKKELVEKYNKNRRTIERWLKLETRVSKDSIPKGYTKDLYYNN